MLSARMKPAVVRIITPLCRGLLKIGITPDLMTIFGTLIVVIGSFTLLANGKIAESLIIIGLALLTDLFDGTMARLSDRGPSNWGNFLDSTLDRISDAAVLIGLSLYLHNEGDSLFVATIITIATSSIVPYARAKAESLGIECKGGFAERPERLLILCIAGILHLAGFSWAIDVGVWILLLTSLLTIYQRMAIVWKATR